MLSLTQICSCIVRQNEWIPGPKYQEYRNTALFKLTCRKSKQPKLRHCHSNRNLTETPQAPLKPSEGTGTPIRVQALQEVQPPVCELEVPLPLNMWVKESQWVRDSRAADIVSLWWSAWPFGQTLPPLSEPTAATSPPLLGVESNEVLAHLYQTISLSSPPITTNEFF